jgi:predicted porin
MGMVKTTHYSTQKSSQKNSLTTKQTSWGLGTKMRYSMGYLRQSYWEKERMTQRKTAKS